MIAHVQGNIVEKFNGSIIVDVGGVGYEVLVSAGDYDQAILDTAMKFYTVHHVREQSEDLYGFSTLAAKKLFEMLITVQGVGPKAALAILSLGQPETVRNAIAQSDSAYITTANGIGKKTAERVVVDLSDKVGIPTAYGRAHEPVQTQLNTNDEALEALIALGYTLADATKALEHVDSRLTTSQRVKAALQGSI